MGGLDRDFLERSGEFGAGVEKRVAEVDVVKQHVGRRREALVDHPVPYSDARRAGDGFDAPIKDQVLGEHRGLSHLALAPKHAGLATPVHAIATKLGWRVGDAPVQREVDRGTPRVVEVRGRLALGAHDVVKPAGGEQPRE